jgi:hypothetical protein
MARGRILAGRSYPRLESYKLIGPFTDEEREQLLLPSAYLVDGVGEAKGYK